MDKEYFTELTNDLYRLTLMFPKKEPLRYKLRESAGTILEDLVMILEGDAVRYNELAFEIKKSAELLDTFLEIAKKQNWVVENYISDIQNKYNIIREEIEKFEGDEDSAEMADTVDTKEKSSENLLPASPPAIREERPFFVLTSRQEVIVELLKEREKIQVRDAQAALPKITKRTLRRDFDVLMKSGVVRRIGKANTTFYKLADKKA